MLKLLRAGLLPTLSGVLYFLSWIGFGIWPLTFVCFVPLVWALRKATLKQAVALGAWMGFVTHLGGYTWVIHLLTVFAFLPIPVAVTGYLVLCVAQGFLFAVFAFLLRYAWLRSGWRLALLLPVALGATEFAYPMLFQSYTGAALMPLRRLIQTADLGGPLLPSMLVALVNGAIADVLISQRAARRNFPAVSVASAALALAVAFGYGTWRISKTEKLQVAAPHVMVGIAQPNVGEVELHQNPQASVRTLQEQTEALYTHGADLVIWPEGGFNTRAVRTGDPTIGRVIQAGVPVPLIAGVIRVHEKDVWNSAVVISKDGTVGDHYDKIKLLAFGEYIPFGDWFPIVYRWSPMSSRFSQGATTAPLQLRPWRFATFICYEDILPGLVRKTMEDDGEGPAHAMVNLTNDSWYGAGHEQEQHLQLAAMRSAEHHRWLLRATSTGVSAFIDATGQVVKRIPANVRDTALEAVPMLEGVTLYGRLGDWPGWFSTVVLVGIAARRLWMRREKKSKG